MADSTKALIGAIAALAALVAVFAIMSDCSKQIASVEADPQKACVEGGGHWSRLDTTQNQIGHCERPSK